MASLRNNIAANFAGSVWTGIVSLVFIPLYIHFMGVESYGLVGFFVTLQAVLGLLDAGLATTLNREFARLSSGGDFGPTMRRLLRTFETIYWAVALVAGFLVMLLARWIATKWFNPEKLSIDDVQQTIVLMGVAFIMQWPLSLYTGGLMGLQEQVSLSVINAAAATLRGVGAVLVLWLVSPTVQTFFVWQVIVSLLHTATVALAVWHGIGGTRHAAFDGALLRTTWRFAAGMTVISVLSAALTQLDKLVVSKALSLETFGYYVFAGTVAASLYRVITPIFSATFPRFSQLVARDAGHELAALYHTSTQMMAVVVLPAAMFLALFAHEVLLLWTRDATTAGNTHRILSLLVVGTAMNGVLTIPFAVQLAYGWTRIVIVTNLVAVALLIPGVLFLSRTYGAPGAAFVWLAYNTGAAIAVPAFMHARVLRGQLMRWYFADVALPLAVILAIGVSARLLVPDVGNDVVSLVAVLFPIAALMQLGAVLAVPGVRRRLLQRFRPETEPCPR